MLFCNGFCYSLRSVVLLFSKDESFAGVPMWGVVEDLDEFTVSHASWNVSVVDVWLADAGLSLTFSPHNVESLVDVLESSSDAFPEMLDDMFSVLCEKFAGDLIPLGFHCTYDPFNMDEPLMFNIVVAVPDGDKFLRMFANATFRTGSDLLDFTPVEGTCFNFRCSSRTKSLKSRSKLAQWFASKAEYPSIRKIDEALTFSSIGGPEPHVWLHEVFSDTGSIVSTLGLERGCLLASPKYLVTCKELYNYSAAEIAFVASRLATPSQELDDDVNEFRLMAATLFASIDAASLHDTTLLLLDS